MLAMKLFSLQLASVCGEPLDVRSNADILEPRLTRSIAIGVVCVKDLYSITSHVLCTIEIESDKTTSIYNVSTRVPCDMWKNSILLRGLALSSENCLC